MADLTITAANVGIASSDATILVKQAGVAITRGQTVYLDTTDSNKAKLADNDASSATATVYGVAMSETSADGDYLAICTGGTIKVGATVVAGQEYVQSSTAGGIAPFADLGSSDYVSIVFRGVTTTTAKMEINNTGTQIA